MRSRTAILLGVVFVVTGVCLLSWPFVRARMYFGSVQPLAVRSYVDYQGVVEQYYLTIAPSRSVVTAGVEGVATVTFSCWCEARRNLDNDPSNGAESAVPSGCVTDVSFVCVTNPSASFMKHDVPTGSYNPQWLVAKLSVGSWSVTATPQDDQHPVASCTVTVEPATVQQFPPEAGPGSAVQPVQYSTLFGGILLAAGVGSVVYGVVFRGF